MAKRHMGTKQKKSVAARVNRRATRKSNKIKKSKDNTETNEQINGRGIKFGQRLGKASSPCNDAASKPLKSILKKRRGETSASSTKSAVGCVGNEVEKNNDPQVKRVRKRFFITKADKEKLETLQPKARRRFIRSLKIKQNPNCAIIYRAKALYIKLRKKKKLEERLACLQIHQLVKGKLKELIYTHDMVRIFQACLKFGGRELVEEIFEEVKDEIVKMAKSKYARYMVIKFLKYGTPAQRSYVIGCFGGSIPELSKHVFASDVVAYAYEFASAKCRNEMVKEFFGAAGATASSQVVDFKLGTLFSDEVHRKCARENLKKNLTQFAGKPVLQNALFHRLLRLYLENCDDEDGAADEMVELFHDHTLHFVATLDGTVAAMRILWKASPKQRHKMVKSLRDYTLKVASQKNGYLYLLSVFDTVDEIEVLKNYPLKEIGDDVNAFLTDTCGRKVLCYLLAGRNCKVIVPQHLSLLSGGLGNAITKKSIEQKQRELLEMVCPIFTNYAITNMASLLNDSSTIVFVLTLVTNVVDNLTPLYQGICGAIAQGGVSLLEKEHVQFTLAQLMKRERQWTNEQDESFSHCFVNAVDTEVLKSIVHTRSGSFMFLRLYETQLPSVQEKVRSAVANLKAKNAQVAGLKLLFEKMNQ